MDRQSYEILYKIEREHWWFKGRRKILDSLIGNIDLESEHMPRILDAGCSVGTTLSFLQRYGDAHGLDVCVEALRICCRQNLSNILQADARNLPFLKESYDLLVALDLLEHLENADQCLKEFNRVLKKGGYLIISVPAYQFLWTNFDLYAHHFKRYRIRELKKMVEKEGFTIKKISYINCFLFSMIVVKRLADKLFRFKKLLIWDFKIPIKIINTILEKIFCYEANLVNMDGFSFPFGSSILCVAQKIEYGKQ